LLQLQPENKLKDQMDGIEMFVELRAMAMVPSGYAAKFYSGFEPSIEIKKPCRGGAQARINAPPLRVCVRTLLNFKIE
jgi:hypothetical protein